MLLEISMQIVVAMQFAFSFYQNVESCPVIFYILLDFKTEFSEIQCFVPSR